MEKNMKEVYFEEYCKTCKNYATEETTDPCDHCLEVFARENSHKPINWKENKK